MAQRILIDDITGRQWFVQDTSKDFHTQYGAVPADALRRRKRYRNDRGRMFTICPASFADALSHLKRGAQVILPKDAAMILAYTGVGKKSVVVDAGAGSGWLSCFLSQYVKQVYSYDINERHIEIARKNVTRIGAKNVSVQEHDIYTGIPEKADVLTLDVPEPWRVLPFVKSSLRAGGYVVCYSPSISQSQETVNTARELGLTVVDTIECGVRSWGIQGRRVRPERDQIGPTGFITFLRVA
ncbi:MAG: tRNA (adenine-N1)-methyltransferase [Nanoarchaeota archaeon]